MSKMVFISIFNFGINLGLTGGKYFTKNFFNFKIEICIFEISNVPSFNKVWTLLILVQICSLTGGKYLIKIIWDIKVEIGIFEISNVPNFNKS